MLKSGIKKTQNQNKGTQIRDIINTGFLLKFRFINKKKLKNI